MLTRIRTALGDARGASVDVPRDYLTAGTGSADLIDTAARLDLLAMRLADYGAVVHRCTVGGVAGSVAAAATEHGIDRLIAPGGVPAEWLRELGDQVEILRDTGATGVTDLDRVDAVLTGCAVAIAETGTLVLDGSPRCGRRAVSLVPDRHLCVVAVEDVVGSVPSALPRLDPGAPQTWISGPSATSDIELSRVEGVHGPRNLEVILIGSD